LSIPNSFGNNDEFQTPAASTDHSDLASWIMTRVEAGRRARDDKYSARWREYTRMWRGFYAPDDKNNDSERSKLIAPALQQAVEMTVAEIEEAVFNKAAWFDIEEKDYDEQMKEVALAYRDQLLHDFEDDNVPGSCTQVFLLGAVYGTGIAKINVLEKECASIVNGERKSYSRIAVDLYPIRPDEFVIDPSATCIEDALYCAHEIIKPAHTVKAKQKQGLYKNVILGRYTGQKPSTDGTLAATSVAAEDDAIKITEYYGKIPGRYVGAGPGLVESIVTIANDSVVLRAIESPFLMKDRPIVAYQHDTVPGEFWGRGVCEKGYNPQKALDAELRARIDTLALITAPMMGADLTRIGRHTDMRVRPGKTVFTRGRPSEIYEPIAFGSPEILAHTFQHSGDLERMVQMGTGAMDTATPVGVNARNETASGMSQLQAGFIKRSKRTMQNIERHFLDPLVKKAVWRYMQYDDQRYPADLKFVVNATMGIMAKEVENAQLINMLGFVPQDSEAFPILVQAIFENSASANKKQLREAIAAMTQPPSEEEQQMQKQMQELQLRAMQAEVMKAEAEAQRAAAEAERALAQAHHTMVKADLEDDMIEIQAANAATAAQKARAATSQTLVAAQRNLIESKKAANKSKSK
jgi:hypothetical protein